MDKEAWGRSSSLSLTAALGSHVAATTARCEASTAVTLEISTALTASTVTTTTASTSSAVAIAAIGIATGATLLDKDLLAANPVRVGGNRSSVAGGLGKFNESTVLGNH